MDTEKANIYADTTTMLTGLSTGQIDTTDQPASANYIDCIQNNIAAACTAIGISNSANFYITTPISEHGVFEIQFDLSNTFWGVPFNFGNDATCTAGAVAYAAVLSNPLTQTPVQGSASCPGVSIRQGLTHLIDKVSMLSTITNCNGGSACSALDTDVPLGLNLPAPNVCGWDTLFTAANNVGPCNITTGAPGSEGNAYHFGTASAGNCLTAPLFAWEPGCGTPDFCAAADHFIAAGVASGKDATTCVLTGATGVGAGATGINVFTRTSQPRHDLGNSFADAICALFTGQFRAVGSNARCLDNVVTPTTGLTLLSAGGPFVTQETGVISQFHGFQTTAVAGSPPNNDWFAYLGAFISVFPFDSLTYGVFNSSFADNSNPATAAACPGSTGAPSVLTGAASDYLYNCIALYDQLSNAMEFSPAAVVGSPGPAPDPTAGTTTPTFASVTGVALTGYCALSPTRANNCTANSAGYQVENLAGQQALDIPAFGLSDKFVYTSNFNNGVINGVSAGIPNFFSFINAYTNSPAGPGANLQNCPSTPAITGPDCYRQGFAAQTTSLNPFHASTFWDFNIIGNIYDSLGTPGPLNTNQVMGYMTSGAPVQLANGALGYTPAAGTVTSLRFTLRPDVFFQNGQKVTSWDVKFSYLELKATGAFQSTGIAPVQDVHVLSPTIFDLNLNAIGPFTLISVVGPTILPGSLWTGSGSSAWNSAESTCSGPAVASPETCFTTADPTAYNVTSAKFAISYDPMAVNNPPAPPNFNLVGSGAFECTDTFDGTFVVGGGCSNNGNENPTVNYQLTRFGAGTTPALAAPSSKYFRSSGTLASYIWAGNNGGTTHDFLNISQGTFCFNKAAGTAGCTQWQQGIGNPTGNSVTFKKVTLLQVGAISLFRGVHWTAPFDYLPGIFYPSAPPFTPNPPAGVAAVAGLTLFEGTSTGNQFFASGTEQVLKPASAIGCGNSVAVGSQGDNGYDC